MLRFKKFPVTFKLMDKRDGRVSRFAVECFFLTVSKSFIGEPFSVS